MLPTFCLLPLCLFFDVILEIASERIPSQIFRLVRSAHVGFSDRLSLILSRQCMIQFRSSIFGGETANVQFQGKDDLVCAPASL